MKLGPHLPIKYGFDGIQKPSRVPYRHLHTSPDNVGGHFYASFDNRLWLFYRLWEPPGQHEEVKATLMIVHGTVDHSGVYAGLANELTKKGIAVIAMDMRGWGLSDGESMYLNDMDTFVEDVNTLYRKIHALPRFEKVKSRFLLGKSLGGLITAFAVAAYPTNWTGLLGLSGAYQLDPGVQPSPLLVCIMRGIGMVVPKLAFKEPFDEHLIFSDNKALEAWRQDDLCCKDKLRLGYGINILQGTQELVSTRVVGHLNIPMLMMIGDADRVVTKAGHELMVNRSQHYDTKLQVYPHGYHNLLQEPALQGQLMMDICNWILKRSF